MVLSPGSPVGFWKEGSQPCGPGCLPDLLVMSRDGTPAPVFYHSSGLLQYVATFERHTIMKLIASSDKGWELLLFPHIEQFNDMKGIWYFILLIILIYFVCAGEGGMHVDIKGQLERASSLLPSCRSPRSTSGHQACQWAPFPMKPSCRLRSRGRKMLKEAKEEVAIRTRTPVCSERRKILEGWRLL